MFKAQMAGPSRRLPFIGSREVWELGFSKSSEHVRAADPVLRFENDMWKS